MEDSNIIELYWARKEDAIRETAQKYGRLCHSIAQNVLASPEDCEECVNDTYFVVWNQIPPRRPRYFPAFLGKITRNLALKKYEYLSAEKRNPEAQCSLDELSDCVSGRMTPETELDHQQIEESISAFLWRQTQEKRDIFVLRYWYFESIESICRRTGYQPSKVKSILFHLRQKLKTYLEKEGIEL